jgi:SAM-dependent methyltransferase
VSSPTNAPKLPVSDPIAKAYDALAAHYDSQVSGSQWIRKQLWERMDLLFPAGSRVLDVTAGTGLDALHLAERSVHVVACDISPQMLSQLHAKNPKIETRIADFNHLELDEEFDGLISTFAGLNTARDLCPFATNAAGLLRPGGVLLIHVLNRWPLLDILRQFTRLRWQHGLRMLASSERDVNLDGNPVRHYLYSPLSIYRRIFAPGFQLSRVSGQGILRPVESEGGHPLERVERKLAAAFPFYLTGTFFLLEMVRRQAALAQPGS